MKKLRDYGIIIKESFNYKAVFVCVLISSLFLFTNADKKLCEIFLANRNINVEEENILLVKGVSSVESEFSGSREKIAESVLMLEELGAEKIFFDFDLSKKSNDNLFFDADAYLENCLKVKNNVSTSLDILDGKEKQFDYKNVGMIDRAVIQSVKEKLEESNSVDCNILYEIKKKENALVKMISELEDDGYFGYTPDFNSPYAASVDFLRKREILFDTLENKDVEKENVFNKYVEAKNHFVECVSMYLNSFAEELLTENADERANSYGDISKRFSDLENIYNEYNLEKNKIKEKIENTTCVFAPDDTVYNLAAVLFCLKSFVKYLPCWVGIIIAIIFCIGCDVLCKLVKPLENKICISLGFIYISVLIPYVLFHLFGIYIGTVVCLISCILMLAYEILESRYGIVIKGDQSEGKSESKSEKYPAVNKKKAVVVCELEHYDVIIKEFESEKDSLVLFNRYYDLISKTAENFGGKENSRKNGKICFTFKSEDGNDIAVESCKALIKIRAVIAKLNAKLMKEEILEKEISFDIKMEMII